ncbi:MAG: phosphoglycerate kinase [Candidatus Marinimicrobia bacterium CG08_land_8_20_14_0_20_45_22]|nr:MAG: phosphoglycerate kinase [Candidatus Marinimicrobia bacterium CG08_land_8_20_14_0_20_45_22]
MARLTIDDLKVEGKRVLIRVDFNVPLDKSQNITDDFRIRAALPTIQKLLAGGARVILMSHLGRPKGKKTPEFSLKPVAERLQKYLRNKVYFSPDCIGIEVKSLVNSLQNGEVLLLENLRFYAEEEKNDPDFSAKLADLADIYVNDAFGTSHRAHASTAGICQYIPQRAAGYLLEKELHYLHDYLENPAKPYTAVLGGAKVTGKIEIIERLFGKVDNILIGGGMAYTFLKALGYEIGKSLLEVDKIALAKEILEKAKKFGCQIILPKDVVIADEVSETASCEVVSIDKIPEDKMGVDIGPETSVIFSEVIEKSKTVLWNGPVGVFEMKKFSTGTETIARKLAEITKKGAVTVVGGGDSASAMEKFGLMDKVTHVSTGGGASLELLSGMELIPVTLISNK